MQVKDLFRKKQGLQPVLNRWSLLLVSLAVVAGLLILWEVMEHNFFRNANPKTLHRWHLYRDVLGATVTTLVAVKVVLSNWERAQSDIIQRDRFVASIADNSGDAIIVLDAQGDIVFWNRAAEGMLGYAQAETAGKNFQFLGIGEKVAAFLDSVRDRNVVHNHEMEIITKGGKRILTSLTGTLIRNPDGLVSAVSILMQDITQKKISQEKLEQSDRVEALSQLAASIAHEIGTPLNVISGNAEYLGMDKEAWKSPAKELKIIVEETERISKLIKRLMHITQRQSLDMKPVDVNTVVHRVLDFTFHEMAKAKVVLESRLEEGLPAIHGDADQLEQVILNIVMNAIEAMRQGGRLFVSTSPWFVDADNHPFVQMRVSDTGVGIPKEIITKVFDPFFSTKVSRGNSGLGLSVSYRIIEAHKGTMKIESALDKGTTVTIRLPSVG